MKTASFKQWRQEGWAGAPISVARWAPSHFTGLHYPDLAPGHWFKSLPFGRYQERYEAEMLGRWDAHKVWDDLQRLAHGLEPVLLCWELAPLEGIDAGVFGPEAGRWCHRRIVADWFFDELGVVVPEIGQPACPRTRIRVTRRA